MTRLPISRRCAKSSRSPTGATSSAWSSRCISRSGVTESLARGPRHTRDAAVLLLRQCPFRRDVWATRLAVVEARRRLPSAAQLAGGDQPDRPARVLALSRGSAADAGRLHRRDRLIAHFWLLAHGQPGRRCQSVRCDAFAAHRLGGLVHLRAVAALLAA